MNSNSQRFIGRIALITGGSRGIGAAIVRRLALDFAARGITVNNIQPGPTATDMNPADAPYLDHLIKLVPLGRLGTADEIAGMAAYLANDDASFVTGASLTVDGGYLA